MCENGQDGQVGYVAMLAMLATLPVTPSAFTIEVKGGPSGDRHSLPGCEGIGDDRVNPVLRVRLGAVVPRLPHRGV